MYIVKFKNQECWLADWTGDPGRTIVKENAEVFENKILAQKEIDLVMKNNSHRNLDLVIVPIGVDLGHSY